MSEGPKGLRISIRWKIVILLGLVVGAITGLDALLVPTRAAEAERHSLRQRSQAAAAMLADSVRPALEFEQSDAAQQGLRAALADPLVLWASVYDQQGQRITAVGDGSPSGRSRVLALTQAESGLVAGLAEVTTEDGNPLGWVGVGLRADGVSERRASTQQTIAIQGVLVAIVGLMIAFWIATQITKSVSEIRLAAERIARGDVDRELQLRPSNDELGDMARSFHRMNERLRELSRAAARVADGDLTGEIGGDGELYASFRQMLQSLRELTTRIASSSESVSSAAAGMFSAVREQQTLATQQTSALEEIRKTLESLSDAARGVAEDASSVRDMSGRTLESSQRMAEHTRLVSAHSERIGEILQLIQDIADRSDLLALNAALEGTKAGEVGRGFSLVAAEMRRLSEHVMDSVRDIRKLVADMRAASHSSVLATEESTKLAKDAASAAVKISDAVRRQQEGTNQAKVAADEVVRAVNESLSGAEDTTASAESLLELSHDLKNTLRAFRTGETA
ncbi:MAG: HAMP domain-containing protein [Sandaracinaceae bacterium]|nr:HAMP domain-containing protein [Sandaracinaceae bacterium]